MPRTWPSRPWCGRLRAGDALLTDLTWDTSSRRLAYFYVGDSVQASELWQLDTAAPGAALLSGRRLLPQVVGPDQVQDALLAPDRQHIIAAVTYDSDVPVTAGSIVGGIVQLSAQTGKPLQTLLPQRAVPSALSPATVTSCQLTSVDPTGGHLLVSCDPDKFGRLDRGRFTTLPVAGTAGVFAAAW